MQPVNSETKTCLGWREWLGLPSLGLNRIKAKIDTGAKTSALHTFKIEEFTRENKVWVRFWVHPYQNNSDHFVICEAEVKDQRMVCDSGGHKEQRYVIETQAHLGNISWPIDITLTNRDTMRFRMLLGRRAMHDMFYVDPDRSYQQGKRLAKSR